MNQQGDSFRIIAKQNIGKDGRLKAKGFEEQFISGGITYAEEKREEYKKRTTEANARIAENRVRIAENRASSAESRAE